jgi:hypothetical protein
VLACDRGHHAVFAYGLPRHAHGAELGLDAFGRGLLAVRQLGQSVQLLALNDQPVVARQRGFKNRVRGLHGKDSFKEEGFKSGRKAHRPDRKSVV